MSTDRFLDAEPGASGIPRCRRDNIHSFWGLRRPPIHDDESGAECVVVGIGGVRFVFRAIDKDWYAVEEIRP